MGCSNCSQAGGCESHKVPQRAAIDAVLTTLYPSREWGMLDDEARLGAGIGPTEARRLARMLAVAARAPSFHRGPGPEDHAETIYLLCVGRAPALVDVRDGLAAPEGDGVRERYLRVHLSHLGRLACVQEVAMELERDGAGWLVREVPRPGVYDPQLLKRMRKVVALIEAQGIEHLDFGLLDGAHPDLLPGEYPARFGVPPALVNYLFYAQPARTSVTTYLG
jgi:hypothetical protein